MAGDWNTAVQRTARKIKDIGSGVAGDVNVLLTSVEIGEEVDAAVIQYSKDRPRTIVKDLTGQTDSYIAVSDLTGWVSGWSRLLSLESQAAAVGAAYTPLYTNIDDAVAEYQDSSALYLRLLTVTPQASDILRFRFTAPHTLTNSADTIPAPDFDAVCDLAASYCCKRLAAKFSATSDSTIAADSVNYRDGQLRMKQTGEDFFRSYASKVGVALDGPAAAELRGDWDTFSSWGRERLFHRTRLR